MLTWQRTYPGAKKRSRLLEYIRWTANHLDLAWVRALIRPNLALQSLTTREPDLKILEVGIRAFNAMRAAEEAAQG